MVVVEKRRRRAALGAAPGSPATFYHPGLFFFFLDAALGLRFMLGRFIFLFLVVALLGRLYIKERKSVPTRVFRMFFLLAPRRVCILGDLSSTGLGDPWMFNIETKNANICGKCCKWSKRKDRSKPKVRLEAPRSSALHSATSQMCQLSSAVRTIAGLSNGLLAGGGKWRERWHRGASKWALMNAELQSSRMDRCRLTQYNTSLSPSSLHSIDNATS